MPDKREEQGVIGIVVLAFVAAMVAIGAFYATAKLKILSINSPLPASDSAPILTRPSPQPNNLTYADSDLGFSFAYPAQGFSIVADDEAKYRVLSGADQRQEFYQTWWYQPPTLIKGLYVKPNSTTDMNQFSPLPFTVWVFDNPDNLDPNQWYNKYWYYPFLWGDYQPRKGYDGPETTATISGQPAAYRIVDFQPGSPQFIYIPKGGRMFLIRIFDDQSTDSLGTKILSSFKFN